MATTTKTIRVDTEFLSIVQDYSKLISQAFGGNSNINGLLTSSMIRGFGKNLGLLEWIISGTAQPSNPSEAERFNEDFKQKAAAIIEKFREYEAAFETANFD